MIDSNLTSPSLVCTAFAGHHLLVTGPLDQVVRTAKAHRDETPAAQDILIFRDATGEQVDIDLGGPLKQLLKHLPAFAQITLEPAESEEEAVAPAGRGRPKIGVVAREVTLLPRHWTWLGEQPGGASVTLRKLVEEARRASQHQDTVRWAREATNRFLTALAGNLPQYEAVTRALFAGQSAAFEKALSKWPADVQAYARRLAAPAFTSAPAE